MSRNPLIIFDQCPQMLPPQYFGSIQYYATMAQYAHVRIANNLRYDKRFKSIHRCEIADTQGRLTLTVPVSKTPDFYSGPCPNMWRDVQVSSHAGWWGDHIVSLESAYGRTPFFEFYFDRFRPLLSDNHLPITQLDAEIDMLIRQILGLETIVEYVDSPLPPRQGEVMMPPYGDCAIPDYYQVRKDRLGFIPGLSILDLIFNMGPEAPLILYQLIRH